MEKFKVTSALVALMAMWTADIVQADPSAPRTEYDICDPQTLVWKPPTAYIDIGESTVVYVDWSDERSKDFCYMVFRTCDFCKIKIEQEMFESSVTNCAKASTTFFRNQYHNSGVNLCYFVGCSSLLIYDQDYKDDVETIVTSSAIYGARETESRHLNIKACNKKSESGILRVRITAIEKEQIIRANPSNIDSEVKFSSPFFPKPYTPNNELYKYKFIAPSDHHYITVTFDDWFLMPNSEIQFDSANIYGPISGRNKRPYVISDSSEMTMTFRTGDNSYAGDFYGFKAVVKFYSDRAEIPAIRTDCGAVMSGSEGGVLRLSSEFINEQYIDCIWVIQRYYPYDGIYVKLLNFFKTDSAARMEENLELRAGVTSAGKMRLQAYPSYAMHRPYSAQTSTDGFYIRLKGVFSNEKAFEMAFTPYRNACYPTTRNTFTCTTGRCIPDALECDGFDHCGDSSDETLFSCGSSTRTPTTSHTSSPLSISVIIPIVVSVFLMIVISLLIIFIRRCRKLQVRTYRNRAGGRQYERVRHRRGDLVGVNVTVASGEHPPSYEEVLQSTPIGCLNMAYSWSNDPNLAQPPSYEEAIRPMSSSTTENSVSQSGFTDDHRNHQSRNGRDSRSLRQDHPVGLSIDGTDYTSSSSSSDDDRRHQRRRRRHDTSSSDSSTDNEPSLVPDVYPSAEPEEIGPPQERSGAKDEGTSDTIEGVGQGQVIKYSRDNEDVQMVIGFPNPKSGDQRMKNRDNRNNQRRRQYQDAAARPTNVRGERSSSHDESSRNRNHNEGAPRSRQRPPDRPRRTRNNRQSRSEEHNGRARRSRHRQVDEVSQRSESLRFLDEPEADRNRMNRGQEHNARPESQSPNRPDRPLERRNRRGSQDEVHSESRGAQHISPEREDLSVRAEGAGNSSDGLERTQRLGAALAASGGESSARHPNSGTKSSRSHRYDNTEDQFSKTSSLDRNRRAPDLVRGHRLAPTDRAQSHGNIFHGSASTVDEQLRNGVRPRPASLALGSNIGVLPPVPETVLQMDRELVRSAPYRSQPALNHKEQSTERKIPSSVPDPGSEEYEQVPQQHRNARARSEERLSRPPHIPFVGSKNPTRPYPSPSNSQAKNTTTSLSNLPSPSQLKASLHLGPQTPRTPQDQRSPTGLASQSAFERLMKGHVGPNSGIKVIDPTKPPGAQQQHIQSEASGSYASPGAATAANANSFGPTMDSSSDAVQNNDTVVSGQLSPANLQHLLETTEDDIFV